MTLIKQQKKIDDMLEQGPNNVDEERNNILRSSFGSRSGRRPESMDEVTNSKQDLNPGMAVLRSLPVPRKQVSSDSEKISKQQGTYNASIFEYTHPSLVGSATFSKDFHPPVDPPEKSSSIGSMSNNSKITLDEFP